MKLIVYEEVEDGVAVVADIEHEARAPAVYEGPVIVALVSFVFNMSSKCKAYKFVGAGIGVTPEDGWFVLIMFVTL